MNAELQIDAELRLSQISLIYVQDIFEAFDTNIITFLPIDEPPTKREDTIAFVEHSVKQIESGDDLVWVILNENKFIGCCGIHAIKSKHPHFALWIKKDQQGKGFGKKVVDFVLKWAFNTLDIEFIRYPVDRRNIKSIKLLEGYEAKLFKNYEMGDKKKLDVVEYHLYKV